MGDIGDEVAAGVLQALVGGAVLDEDEDVPAPDAGDPHVEEELAGPGHVAARDGEFGVLGRASGPHAGDHGADLRLAHGVVAHEVEGVGGGGGAQDVVVLVQDDDGRAQDRQHGDNGFVPDLKLKKFS